MTNPTHIPISGGPAWVNSDRYTIDAKAGDPETLAMMNGPMLQALLEERFRLKVHREIREVPVYSLTEAKTGLKLKPFQEGSCTPIDILQASISRVPGVTYCRYLATEKDGLRVFEAQATSLDDFCQIELGFLDRPVVNKTGIAGLFDIHLEYVPENSGPSGSDDVVDTSGPPLFTAIQQQLGLKIERDRGPGQFVVIDHVEKPSEN